MPVRVEQPGLDFAAGSTAPADDTTTRRPLIFKRDEVASSPRFGRLLEIVATDGGVTKLDYDGDHVSALRMKPDTEDRVVELNVDDGELREIRHKTTSTATPVPAHLPQRVRAFEYGGGLLTQDLWKAPDGSNLRQTIYTYAPPPLIANATYVGLQAVTLGDASSSTSYDIVPAVTAALQPDQTTDTAKQWTTSTGTVSIDADYGAAISQFLGSSAAGAGSFTSRNIRARQYDWQNQVEVSSELFERDPSATDSEPVEISRSEFVYDTVGSVVQTTDPLGRVARYHYDYEYVPGVDITGTGSAVGLTWRYDVDSYRGNVTRTITPGASTGTLYVTAANLVAMLAAGSANEADDDSGDASDDDSAPTSDAAVGLPLRTYVISDSGQRINETEFLYTVDGRIKALTRAGGYLETWEYHDSDLGQLQRHTDAQGLITEYRTYIHAKPQTVRTTDQSVPNQEAIFVYDDFGHLHTTKTSYEDSDGQYIGFSLDRVVNDPFGLRARNQHAPDRRPTRGWEPLRVSSIRKVRLRSRWHAG